ncbi:MAG: hypothetical protein ABIK94_05880, partial [candidate division WOR-3 bacterium]
MDIKDKVKISKELIIKIAEIGWRYSLPPSLKEVFPFEHYFDNEGNLIRKDLDKKDGPWTRRELLARYLLVNAVLDQGPDMKGVSLLLKEVVNS